LDDRKAVSTLEDIGNADCGESCIEETSTRGKRLLSSIIESLWRDFELAANQGVFGSAVCGMNSAATTGGRGGGFFE